MKQQSVNIAERNSKIINLRKQGMTYNQIASELKISHPTIANVLEMNGMLKQQFYTPLMTAKIKQMASIGMTAKDIAINIGVSYTSLRTFMSRNKIRVNRNNENMRKVLELSETMSSEEIARKTGLKIEYVRSTRYKKGVSKSAASYRRDRVSKLWKEGNSIEKIALKTGIKRYLVSRYLREARTLRDNDNL